MDHYFLSILNDLAFRHLWLDATIIFFAKYLAHVLIATAVIYFLLAKLPRQERIKGVILAIAAPSVARLIVEAIRFFYHRVRPLNMLPIKHLLVETSWSFPSAHATWFFALSTVVYYHNKKLGVVFFILSTLMGLARVAAGVHYPSDILGGAILGVFTGVALLRIVRTPRDTARVS